MSTTFEIGKVLKTLPFEVGSKKMNPPWVSSREFTMRGLRKIKDFILDQNHSLKLI